MTTAKVRTPGPPRTTGAQDPSITFLLADVLRLTREQVRRRAQGMQLTPALARLLFFVDQRPGCRQTELARFLDVSTATIGRMIDRLEASGIMRRVPDTVDRRVFRIHLGKDAGALVERMRIIIDETNDIVLQGLSALEQESLRDALLRMHANLVTEAR